MAPDRVQLDSASSAGPEIAAVFSTSDSLYYALSRIAWGGDTGTFNDVDTGTPLPVQIFNSDSTTGAFVFNSAGAPMFLAGDTAGTPVDDSNPLPVSVISPDTTVFVSNTLTVDLAGNNDVINTVSTPFFIAGDTAGTPVDDTNAFPVAVISTDTQVSLGTNPTVDLGANNDVINTVSTPFYIAGDTAGTPVDDTNAFPVAVISTDTQVSLGTNPTVDLGANNDVINTVGTPFFIAGDTAGTAVDDSNPLPVTIKPSAETGNGLTIFRDATNDTAVASVKAFAGVLYGYYMFNPDTASTAYVHLYNDTAVAMGTDSDVMVFGIPPLGGANAEFTNGIAFTTGISVATTASATSTAADAPGTATIVNLFYK